MIVSPCEKENIQCPKCNKSKKIKTTWSNLKHHEKEYPQAVETVIKMEKRPVLDE